MTPLDREMVENLLECHRTSTKIIKVDGRNIKIATELAYREYADKIFLVAKGRDVFATYGYGFTRLEIGGFYTGKEVKLIEALASLLSSKAMEIQAVFLLSGITEGRLWEESNKEVELYKTLLYPFLWDVVLDGGTMYLPTEALSLLKCCGLNYKDNIMYSLLRSYLNMDLSNEAIINLIDRFSGLTLSELPMAFEGYKKKWTACRKNYRKSTKIVYDLTAFDSYFNSQDFPRVSTLFDVSATEGKMTAVISIHQHKSDAKYFISIKILGTNIDGFIHCGFSDVNLHTSDKAFAMQKMEERLCKVLVDYKYGAKWNDFATDVE